MAPAMGGYPLPTGGGSVPKGYVKQERAPRLTFFRTQEKAQSLQSLLAHRCLVEGFVFVLDALISGIVGEQSSP